MSETPKRAAIVGTFNTWVQTPWDDPDLLVCCLNDAYTLPGGIPRFDRWYDTHPFDKMVFRQLHERVDGNKIPFGHFLRPAGHIEWLQKQAETKEVFVKDVPEGWPAGAKRFPIEDVKALLRARADQDAYSASGPSLILAHLLTEGYTEIHIYGIHLATQHEYIKQRPQLEWLMGKASAMGVTFVLPTTCPLLKHTHVYGYEPEPEPVAFAQQKRLAALQGARAGVIQQLVFVPRWKNKAPLMTRLQELDSKIADVQQQITRAHAYAQAG